MKRGETKDSSNKVSENGIRQKIGSIFQDYLAIIIVISIFGLILGMLVIHIWSIDYIMKGGDVTGFQEIEGANQNLISILLPLFGAWVGTIIAFYYGKENADKAYKSLSDAQKSIDKMVGIRKITTEPLAEVISKNPHSLDLRKATSKSTIKEVFDQAGEDVTNVLIVDDKEQPIGLLFISDINAALASDNKTISEYYNTTLEDFLDKKQVKDSITKEAWTKNGVMNYVPLAITDTAEGVAKKLLDSQFGLSARRLVLEKGKKPYAIITYDMLVVEE